MVLRIAIVGFGKIAHDQHVPAIAATSGIELAAVASRHARHPELPSFAHLADLLASDVAVDAVAFCTPPHTRRHDLKLALEAGKHVLVEKPPGATLSELDAPLALAQARGLTFFTAWHSRFAPAVEPARQLLATRHIRAVRVEWKEDVRVWHPGQGWIWEPGGLGVFDPGINALSIVTRILPRSLFVTSAELSFPANRDTPIAADIAFEDEVGTHVSAAFDWRQTGPQLWNIHIDTDEGPVVLSRGGAQLSVDGAVVLDEGEREYAGIYRHFVALVAGGQSDADLTPLRHVADAFMLGRRRAVEPFTDA